MSQENNFIPSQEPYKPLSPFHLFVKSNFPFIENTYESIDNYGLYCKVVEYLNNVIANENTVESNVAALYNAFVSLNTYMSNYFDNLDVQEEINHKLDELVANGTLTLLIGNYVNPLIEEQNNVIRTLQQQINNVVTNPPIAVNSISEMTDTTRIYVLTTDSKWYYYDGTTWQIGGNYQSTSFNDLIQIKPIDINIQGYLSPSGFINTTAGFNRSDYIEVLGGRTYVTGKLNQSSGGLNVLLIAGYDADRNLIYKFFGDTGVNNINLTIPEGVKYIMVSSGISLGEYYLNANIDGLNYMNNNHDLSQIKQYIPIDITGYITSSGTLNQTNGFKSSDYIECQYGQKIIGHVYGVRNVLAYLSYYDINKNLIKVFTGEPDSGTFEVNIDEEIPVDAKFFRLSTVSDSTHFYIYSYKITNALDWTKFINTKTITVDLLVDKTLTSSEIDNVTTFNKLIPCLRKIEEYNDDRKYIVHVKSGVYDLYDEMGGIEFLQSVTPTDSTTSINQPWLYNTDIIGDGNVKLTYLPSDEDVNTYPLASDLFSPLNIRGNVNIENIEIECQNCRYGIHDETADIAKYYNTYHNYKNVKVTYIKGISYGQALGGGFDNGQRYYFDSCYFKSNRTYAFSYHNRNSNGANFIINNCIFIGNGYNNRSVKFSNVGTQTKNNVNINNCYFNKQIGLTKESDSVDSTNSYQLYINCCNNTNIDIDSTLGTNLYEPIIYNTI